MATVAAVYTTAPFVAEPGGVPGELDAPTAGGKPQGRAAPPGGETGLGESRTGAVGGGRGGDAGSGAPGPRARQALGRARRRGRAAARPRGSERRRVRRGRHGGPRHHPRGRVRVEGRDVFHREGSPELAHWAWTRVRSILEGKARQVAAAMRRAATVAGLSKDTRKPVDTCADYLLKYAPYLALRPLPRGGLSDRHRGHRRGVPVPGPRRMELTGARWRLVGAEAVLKLRALRASGDFDAYWDFHEAREYERNHAQRYTDGTVPPVTEPPPPPSSPRLRRVK